jgi:hypothetical protein
MSLIENYRSKSPKLHPLRFLSPKSIVTSPSKIIVPYSEYTISVNSPNLQFKSKHHQQVNLSNKCKSNCDSPQKTRTIAPKTPKSSINEFQLKLENCK